MREISRLNGSKILSPRSIVISRRSPRALALPTYGRFHNQKALAIFTTRLSRTFHSSHKTTGWAQDILSSFKDDKGEKAAAYAAQQTEAEHRRFLEALDQADGIHGQLKDILREGHPDRVLHALKHPQWGPTFVSRASPYLFDSALKLVRPSHFLKPYLATHFLFDPSRNNTIQEKLRGIRVRQPTNQLTLGYFRMYSSLQERFDRFARHIDDLLYQRHTAGFLPTLETYAYLLDMARLTGDPEMADNIFYVMMDGMKPDRRCYNYFMEAKVWADAHDPYEHDRRFVTPRMLRFRSIKARPPGFTGHRTGKEGLRLEMVKTLDRMSGEGYDGDEATFSHIITAMGREADLEGLKSVLRSVWNIDLDLLQELDEEELETPTFYEWGSPLRPTNRLLFAIAHAYVINMEPLMGLKVVDYLSRQYDLTISSDVWLELLTGTYLRTISRRGQVDPGVSKGRLPYAAFEDMWSVMVDKPHNVKPDPFMHDRRVRAMREDYAEIGMFQALNKIDGLLNSARQSAYKTIQEFLNSCDQLSSSLTVTETTILPASWFDLRNDLVRTQIRLEAVLHVLIFNTHHALKEDQTWGGGRALTYERELFPDLLRTLATLLPNELSIETTGGNVTFHGLDKARSIAIEQSSGHVHAILGLIRMATDQLDHEVLIASIRDLQQNRRALLPICYRCGRRDHATSFCPEKTLDSPKPLKNFSAELDGFEARRSLQETLRSRRKQSLRGYRYRNQRVQIDSAEHL